MLAPFFSIVICTDNRLFIITLLHYPDSQSRFHHNPGGISVLFVNLDRTAQFSLRI